MDESGMVEEQIDWKTHLLSVWHRRSNKSRLAWRTIWNPNGQLSEWRTSRRIKRRAGEIKQLHKFNYRCFSYLIRLILLCVSDSIHVDLGKHCANTVTMSNMLSLRLFSTPGFIPNGLKYFVEQQCCSLVRQRMCGEVPAQQVWVWCRQR